MTRPDENLQNGKKKGKRRLRVPDLHSFRKKGAANGIPAAAEGKKRQRIWEGPFFFFERGKGDSYRCLGRMLKSGENPKDCKISHKKLKEGATSSPTTIVGG